MSDPSALQRLIAEMRQAAYDKTLTAESEFVLLGRLQLVRWADQLDALLVRREVDA